MSINVTNNVSPVDTKKFSKQSTTASNSSSSKSPKPQRDSDTAEVSVSTVAKQLRKGPDSGESNGIETESGSAQGLAGTQGEGAWLDLAASTKYQILQQPSVAMFAQAHSLPREALALIAD